MWAIAVFLVYRPRRVDCPRCGVHVEHLPWASGKLQLCDALRLFLAQWARLLSWQEVASSFSVSWADVVRLRSNGWCVGDCGTVSSHGITALGVDEVSVGKGKFWTVVYQIDEGARRLLWIGKDRTGHSLRTIFHRLGTLRCQEVRFICSDLWKPYLGVIAKALPAALHILDRFHIRETLGEAIDKIRRTEVHALARAGLAPLLKKTRWTLLKHRHNWNANDRRRMRDLMGSGLRTLLAPSCWSRALSISGPILRAPGLESSSMAGALALPAVASNLSRVARTLPGPSPSAAELISRPKRSSPTALSKGSTTS